MRSESNQIPSNGHGHSSELLLKAALNEVASEWSWSLCLPWPPTSDKVSNLKQGNLEKRRSSQTPLHQPQPPSQPLKCDHGGDMFWTWPCAMSPAFPSPCPERPKHEPIAIFCFLLCSWGTNCTQTTRSWVFQITGPCPAAGLTSTEVWDFERQMSPQCSSMC